MRALGYTFRLTSITLSISSALASSSMAAAPPLRQRRSAFSIPARPATPASRTTTASRSPTAARPGGATITDSLGGAPTSRTAASAGNAASSATTISARSFSTIAPGRQRPASATIRHHAELQQHQHGGKRQHRQQRLHQVLRQQYGRRRQYHQRRHHELQQRQHGRHHQHYRRQRHFSVLLDTSSAAALPSPTTAAAAWLSRTAARRAALPSRTTPF